MSIDQLRRGFAELTTDVVPAADPYARVLRRVRRVRRVRRIRVAVAAGVLALAAVATNGALQPGGAGTGFAGWPITSDWTRTLLGSPTRGDFAGDAGLLAEVAAAERIATNPNLPDLKVLWLGGTREAPVALVARYSGTRAVLDSLQRVRGGTEWTGSWNGVLSPLVTVRGDQLGDASGTWTVLLAPPGCDLALRNPASGSFAPAPASDGALVVGGPAPLAVRVTCGGVVLQQGPVGLPESVGVAGDAGTGAAGQALAAYAALAPLTGRGGTGQVAWAGNIPGGGAGALVVDPTAPDRPALLLVAGTAPKALLGLAPEGSGPAGENPTDNQVGRDAYAMVSTSAGAGYLLVAARIPRHAGARAQLTGTMLVYAGPAASQVQALGPDGTVVARADVTDGVAVLALPPGTASKLRAVDRTGAEVGTRELRELPVGARLFDEPIINNW